MKRTVVKITNSYADAVVMTTVQVESPGYGVDLEEWWEDVVLRETGTGRSGPAIYRATVLRSDVPELVGQSHEWMG